MTRADNLIAVLILSPTLLSVIAELLITLDSGGLGPSLFKSDCSPAVSDYGADRTQRSDSSGLTLSIRENIEMILDRPIRKRKTHNEARSIQLNRMMGFGKAIQTCLAKHATFTGRGRRSDPAAETRRALIGPHPALSRLTVT
jgi:hypothetical protein